MNLTASRVKAHPARLGLVFGASGALGTLGITTASGVPCPLWFGGLLGWALWILLVSVTLGLRWRRTRRAPAVAAGSRRLWVSERG